MLVKICSQYYDFNYCSVEGSETVNIFFTHGLRFC